MIVFDLKCGNDHVFEAWFPDSAAFEAQAGKGEVPCPLCGDTRVAKAPMAPAVARGSKAPRQTAVLSPEAAKHAAMMRQLRAVQDHVVKNFDHVGERFPEEARKIHYGEADKRDIYGNTSPDEARALKEEGIEFGSLPWLPRHDS